MHSASLITLLFAGLLALLTGSALGLEKRTFTIQRAQNAKLTRRDGTEALAKVYRKYNMPMPDHLSEVLQKRELARRALATQEARDPQPKNMMSGMRISLAGTMGEVDAQLPRRAPQLEQEAQQQGNNQQQSSGQQQGNGQRQGQVGTTEARPINGAIEFVSSVEIGGQKMTLDFDTGSSDLWVFSDRLPAQAQAGRTVFQSQKSSSFRPEDNSVFNITYGDGSGASGVVGMDTVRVGDVTIDNQPLQLADTVSGQFLADKENDGIMGLVFSQINTVKPQKKKTFLDRAKDTLQEPVFTADFNTNSYTFGGIGQAQIQQLLTWIRATTNKGVWQFTSQTFSVGDSKQETATAGGQAIADTGTTLMMADQKMVEAYYSQIRGAQLNRQVGGVTVPCNAQMPDLNVDVGGTYMAKIAGEDLKFTAVGDGSCFGALQATPSGALGIYGDAFFKSQLVVFNVGNNTLGMAPHGRALGNTIGNGGNRGGANGSGIGANGGNRGTGSTGAGTGGIRRRRECNGQR